MVTAVVLSPLYVDKETHLLWNSGFVLSILLLGLIVAIKSTSSSTTSSSCEYDSSSSWRMLRIGSSSWGCRDAVVCVIGSSVPKRLCCQVQRLSVTDVSSSLSVINGLSTSIVGWDLHEFTLEQLTMITHGFASSNYLGEGGFGTVHKGFIDDKLRPGLDAQPVAVKLLDLDGGQGHNEWLAEVTFLGQLRHPHLVKLIGYCCEDRNRLLVYEYMARGNLESQLFGRYSIPLPWLTQIQIALGAAKGLAFLIGKEKPVIYRDFKTSNILMGSLDGKYPFSGAKTAAALASRCLSHHPKCRPTMNEVVKTLEHILELDDFPVGLIVYVAPKEGENTEEKDNDNNISGSDEAESEVVVVVVEKKENRRHEEHGKKGHRHKHRIRSIRVSSSYDSSSKEDL
ncbi:hypothetical protein L1987_47720 [Smallanthus sonchifolius]|uniref:Uncharacterized protein n=1 Tax=Smallanthus sonchifolius TaxID=185202 RepID=A0ACB9G373_9ASTR|nr:hypothetical protein L1987_47720 [Smallanthus sonchifolius]